MNCLKKVNLGRALAVGALALGSLVGNADANWTDDFDLEAILQTFRKSIPTTYTITSMQNFPIKKNFNSSMMKIKKK